MEITRDIEAKLHGVDLKFKTTPGLFSWKQIDKGTLYLANTVKVLPSEDVLDIGCGYGAIGLMCAAKSGTGTVHMVDTNFVAVEYSKKNAKKNKITNIETYLSNGLSEVKEDQMFDLIISNLPAHLGKDFWRWMFDDVKKHLKPGGRFTIVTIARLKPYIKREFTEVFGNYSVVDNNRQYCIHEAVLG